MCSSSGRYMGFMSGLAIGAGVALLLAPASGAEVRKELARFAGHSAKDVKDQLRDQGEVLLEQGSDMVDSLTEQADQFMDTQTQTLRDTANKAAGEAITRQT